MPADRDEEQRDGGGGSGGSIWIEANTLSGTGQIRANGGSGLCVPTTCRACNPVTGVCGVDAACTDCE